MQDSGPVVTQIKGNGRATGNKAPVDYDTGVLEFLQNYLKPARITESDSYLTPLLLSYKDQLNNAVPYAKGGAVDKNTAFIKAHS